MPSALAKSASIFDGWYTAPNGGGSQFYVDTLVTSDITVYANWTLDSGIQYTVTFDADNGSSAGSNMPANSAKRNDKKLTRVGK
jgi:uncharacterized repeat protein (TIGR02543 family)